MANNPAETEGSVAKLTELIGFDPTKESPTTTVFKAAVEKIQKERDEKLSARVEEQLRKVIELARQRHKLKNDFYNQMNKSGKEIDKLMASLQSIASGKGEIAQADKDAKPDASEAQPASDG